VVIEANPDYWDGAPELQAVVFRPITDANTRTAEMLAGGIDVMVEVPPVALSEFQGDGFTVHEQAGPHVWFLILNALEGPFADVRVRQAANYAVNKEAIVNDVLEGTAEVAAGPTPPAFAWAYNEALEPYPYDPDRARALLAEAGMENPEVTFYVTEGGSGMLDPIAMGTAIQADLEAVGFDVTIETYEWNTFLGEVNPGLEGKADMAEMAWMTNDPDTLPYLALRTAAWPRKAGSTRATTPTPRSTRCWKRPGPPPTRTAARSSTARCRSSCRRTRPGSSSPTGCRTRSRATGSKASGLSRPSSCFLMMS
jgi:peptide/nickel transport system substrate-binding protein